MKVLYCGKCDGIGVFPADSAVRPIWIYAHNECSRILGAKRSLYSPANEVDRAYIRKMYEEIDGYRFIECEACHGSGKR